MHKTASEIADLVLVKIAISPGFVRRALMGAAQRSGAAARSIGMNPGQLMQSRMAKAPLSLVKSLADQQGAWSRAGASGHLWQNLNNAAHQGWRG